MEEADKQRKAEEKRRQDDQDNMRDLVRRTTTSFLEDKYGEDGFKTNKGSNTTQKQTREHLLPVIRLKVSHVMLKGTGWANYYDWLRDLENLVAIHIHIWEKYPEGQKIAIVEATFATEFVKQYEAVVKPTIIDALPEGEVLTYQSLVKGLETHVRRIRNVLNDRLDLFRRTQNPGETYREFEAELLHLGKNAELPLSEDALLMTLVIAGVREDRLRNKLLTDRPKTFIEVRDICLAHEDAMTAQNAIKKAGGHSGAQDVAWVSRGGHNNLRGQGHGRGGNNGRVGHNNNANSGSY